MIYAIIGPLPTPLVNMNVPPKSVGDQIRRNKNKAEWRKSCYYMALTIARKERWPLPWAHIDVQITLGVPDRRRRDPHNYEANAKPLIDALVDAGIVADDSPQWVQVRPIRLSLALKGQYQVEIIPTEWKETA